MADVSKNMKKIRNELGMTQQEVADRLNVTRQAVSSWENGKNHPDLVTLENMARVYDVELEELIYGKKKLAQQRDRKTLIIRAVVFCIIFIILLVLVRYLRPIIRYRTERYYEQYPIMIFSTVLQPAMYAFAAIAGMSVFSVIYDIRLRRRKLRWIFGIIAVIIVWILEMGCWGWLSDNAWNNITYFIMKTTIETPGVYMIPGILFFFAGAKE